MRNRKLVHDTHKDRFTHPKSASLGPISFLKAALKNGTDSEWEWKPNSKGLMGEKPNAKSVGIRLASIKGVGIWMRRAKQRAMVWAAVDYDGGE